MYIFPCLCLNCKSFQTSETEITVNDVHFWKMLKEVGEIMNNSYKKLICEKIFYLCDINETKGPSILTVGIDPQNEFFVYARLKIPKCSSSIILCGDNVKDFLNYLANNIIRFSQSEQNKSYNIRDDIVIEECEQCFFKLHILNKDLIIDD